MSGNPNLVKWLIFFVLAGAAVAADLGTKRWAEVSLATRLHPIPVVVPAEEAGRTVGEVVTGKLGNIPAESVYKLSKPIKVDPEAAILDSRLLELNPAFILFHDDTWVEPPFVLENSLRTTLLEARNQGGDPAGRRAELEGELRSLSVADYFAKQEVRLSRESVGEAIKEGRLFSYPTGAAVRMTQKVSQGDLFLAFDRTLEVIPGVLSMTYVENPGAAWGFLAKASSGFRRTFLGGVSLLAMIFLIYMYRNIPQGFLSSQVAFALIFSGAVGNFVDRIQKGYVIDFIDMYMGDRHWPTYNVADIAISVGIGLMFIEILRKRHPFNK